MGPVPHSEDLPVPHPPKHATVDDASEPGAPIEVQNDKQNDPNFEASSSSCELHLLTQDELNDLVEDTKVSKKQTEILGSRLKGWNLLQKGTKVYLFLNRQEQFQDTCSEENGLVYCNNICAMIEEFGNEHKTTERRLFIGSSKAI